MEKQKDGIVKKIIIYKENQILFQKIHPNIALML